MTRFRRHPALIVWWEGTQPVFHNYVKKRSMRSEPETFGFLQFFDDWRAPEEIVDNFKQWQPAVLKNAVRRLHSAGFLQAEDDPALAEDGVVDWEWTLPVRFFHMATRNLDYVAGPADIAKLYQERLDAPQPPQFKRYPEKPLIALPRVLDGDATPLDVALLRRTTCRNWRREPISLMALSRLLYLAFGVTGSHVDVMTGPLPHKTSPSGGSRHPTEAYPIILNVDGVEPGIYHYAADVHGLELLRKGQFGPVLAWIAASQDWLMDAAVVCVLTSCVQRNMWKYPTDRAYRVITLDVAHLSQTFYLVAAAMGLGPFFTAAFRDRQLERELELDSAWEPAMGICAAGIPDETAFSSLKMTVSRADDGRLHVEDPPWQPPPWEGGTSIE